LPLWIAIPKRTRSDGVDTNTLDPVTFARAGVSDGRADDSQGHESESSTRIVRNYLRFNPRNYFSSQKS
jgi:hypothetical protein